MVPELTFRLVTCLLTTVLLLSTGFSVVVAAESPQEEGWRASRSVGDVDLYRKPVAGSKFPSILASVQLHASPEELLSLLTDYDQFAGFIPNVLESRVISHAPDTQRVYQRLGFPALVSDRHYVIRSTNVLDRSGRVEANIIWSLDRDSMRQLDPNAIVPVAFDGSWQLRALPGNTGTQAFYTVHVDPAGHFPAWLFVRFSENYVVKVISAVKARVKSTRTVKD